MRTKALVALAVLAAGIVTTVAQSNVYSLNIVGYVNYTQPANAFRIITNPLNTTNNDVSNIFASAQAAGALGTTVYKRNASGAYDQSTLDPDLNVWTSPLVVNPGDGVWVSCPAALANTFVGEVVMNATNALPAGYSIKGSIIPQAGKVQTDLLLPAVPGDSLYIWNGSNYDQFVLDPDLGTWLPNEPVVSVAQGFWFYNSAATKNWVRNFTP